jgi:translation initiation factor 2 beta subunit (eIF-2beta)/eIF-5
MAKQINCGVCAIHGETIAMELRDKSFFKCPECGAELHVNDDGDDTFIRYWQQQQQYRSCSLPEGVHVHGGDKKNGKAPGLSKMKKKTINEINNSLYKNT